MFSLVSVRHSVHWGVRGACDHYSRCIESRCTGSMVPGSPSTSCTLDMRPPAPLPAWTSDMGPPCGHYPWCIEPHCTGPQWPRPALHPPCTWDPLVPLNIRLGTHSCDHYPWCIELHCTGPLSPDSPGTSPSHPGHQTWDQVAQPCPPLISDMDPPGDIWWPSLETCSKLFTWGPSPISTDI